MQPRLRDVEFRVAEEQLGLGLLPTVEPVVDGRPLRELVGELEPVPATGAPAPPGTYAGLARATVRWPARHFLGEPVLGGWGTGLLGCTCGDYGCSWLAAEVEVTDRTVTWTGFRCGDGDLPALGEFVFDRSAYEDALRRTAP